VGEKMAKGNRLGFILAYPVDYSGRKIDKLLLSHNRLTTPHT
jgi:hypothetical protein